MQVGGGSLAASVSRLGLRSGCPTCIAERPRELGTKRHVISTAAPLEARGATTGAVLCRGWRPTAATL